MDRENDAFLSPKGLVHLVESVSLTLGLALFDWCCTRCACCFVVQNIGHEGM